MQYQQNTITTKNTEATMSNNKQTAVEWLQKQLNKNGKLSVIDFYQASRMEREQREKDFVNGYKKKAEMSNSTFDEISEDVAKELFKQTFNTEDK